MGDIVLKLIFILGFILLLIYPKIESRYINLEEITDRKITVEVRGAVLNTGTYELDSFSTIADLLENVELSTAADLSSINQAIVLKDNDVLEIPEKKDIELISINNASLEELVTLKGIKETIAIRIIEYRNEHGLFQTIEDLMNVKGIGEKKFASIKPFIKL